MGRLIAVSNRTAADPGSRAGGLAVAVWESLKSTGGVWAGWSGEIRETLPRGATVFRDDGVEFVLTDLTEEEHERYYLGYANQVLWPVFHYRVDLANFSGEDFDAYEAVNRRLGDLVFDRLTDGDSVWVHDYHFLLMANALRNAGWDGPVGFFLHIPFPPPEIFRAVPDHQRLARGLCAYNVIGFQSTSDRANFTRYLVEDYDARLIDDETVEVFGARIRAKAYPIGIDARAFREAAESEAARKASATVGRFLGDRKLIIGVDRMDYSKGLPERFEAVGELLDARPELHGQVSMTQIAPPSRSKVDEYKALRVELDRLAGRINGDYGDLDWIPLRYLARSYDRDSLAGLYRIASVGLVTPLRDGMNLVAKEYVMAQDEADPGVLVLSEFAGAAEQLTEALIVNPHDRSRLADTIYTALTMPLDERRRRWTALRAVIESQDIVWWRERFLEDLGSVKDPRADHEDTGRLSGDPSAGGTSLSAARKAG
ncbi:MAG: trehalose-6-phosphate synthase [Pseudomonadota bacterium]